MRTYATSTTCCSNRPDRYKPVRCGLNPIWRSGSVNIRISALRVGVVPGPIGKIKKAEQPLTDYEGRSQPAREGGYCVLRTALLATILLVAGVGPVLAQDAAAGEKDF